MSTAKDTAWFRLSPSPCSSIFTISMRPPFLFRFLLDILCQAQAAKLPALPWFVKVAVRLSLLPSRRGKAAAAKHQLIAHKLVVVLRQTSFVGPVAGIALVMIAGPAPQLS